MKEDSTKILAVPKVIMRIAKEVLKHTDETNENEYSLWSEAMGLRFNRAEYTNLKRFCEEV